MDNKIIEVITFKLKKGINKDSFIKTIPATNDFIKKCEGFISRRLSCNENGTWLEHVEWENLQYAKAASEEFMKTDSLMPMMQAIDEETIIMGHNQLIISLD